MFELKVYHQYLEFVAARHNVWERRMLGAHAPWTEDPVIQHHKFTNVFRILDPGSQFLVRELLYGPGVLTERDVLARCLLYRFSNRPDVWRYSREQLGRYPLAADLTVSLADLWADWRDNGGQVFSGAYVIMPEPGVKGVDKTRSVVRLVGRLTHPDSQDDIVPAFLQAPGLRAKFNVLRAQRGVGDFIAMQVLTDYGYSRFGRDSENEFIVAGPGARKGIAAVDPQADPVRMIKFARAELAMMEETRLVLPDGNTRPPSYMDTQNTFCEFSKYVRFKRRGKLPASKYRPAHPGPQERPIYPPHWLMDTRKGQE